MNVLFLSISSIADVAAHSISLDLLREFRRNGHNVYIVSSIEKNSEGETNLRQEDGCNILRVKIGNNKRANIIEKGITTLMLPKIYIKAIKKYFSDVKFDLVMYPTPPITHYKTVKFIKKRDGAKSYLLLKDIFPQNAVDLGMLTKSGVKGFIYKHFRKKEKKLYAISDRIGCMSQANCDYVIKHNPSVDPAKLEVCPNSVEAYDMSISAGQRLEIRTKYDVPTDKTVFVYGGNFGKPQGIPFIEECLKTQLSNPDFFFLLVGDGTEFKRLERFFDEVKPSNMKLIKRLPKDDYDKLVSACDVGMIFLDHRFTIPNFPSRLLPYMQAKLPVLACTDPNTDLGKIITEGRFGWWCESNDVSAFQDIVAGFDPAQAREYGGRAYDYLNSHYTSELAYKIIVKEEQ